MPQAAINRLVLLVVQGFQAVDRFLLLTAGILVLIYPLAEAGVSPVMRLLQIGRCRVSLLRLPQQQCALRFGHHLRGSSDGEGSCGCHGTVLTHSDMHFYIVGCQMESDTEVRYWTYTITNDPPAPCLHQPGRRISLDLEIYALTRPEFWPYLRGSLQPLVSDVVSERAGLTLELARVDLRERCRHAPVLVSHCLLSPSAPCRRRRYALPVFHT